MGTVHKIMLSETLLAQVEDVSSAFAFPEKNGHTRGHIHTDESIEISYQRCKAGQCNCFCYPVVCQILPPKGSNL